ncbi:MAG: zinc-binding dehydrogenase [Lentisphaeria bacterium]|nr:zinc-binding dehydrogenase [Lentisphaeria bacterium]
MSPKTMPAIVNYGIDPLSVEQREVPVPGIGAEDVLLQTQAVSVCGSDLHQWRGGISWTVNYPCILGHEFAGVIVEKGSKVKGYDEGDRVISETAAVIDTASPYTRRGLYNLDPNRLGFGYGVNGAMTRYVCVPERCLHSVPEGLDFITASLTEPCCVAYNAVCNYANIKPGDHVLVLGPGPIGLLCTIMAKLCGAGHLVVAGLPADTARLDLARRIGADAALDGGVEEHVRELGDGRGVDVVIDAAGVSATLELALKVVRAAGRISKVGWGPQPLNISLDPLVQKAVTLQGSFSHNWPIWEKVISMLGSGQLDVKPLISRVAALDEWQDCFEKQYAGEYTKVVFQPNG